VSLANKTQKGMSLANNLETDPTPCKICRGYMIGLRYNKMKGRCDESLDNNTSLDDIVLCYDCAMDKAGY
jgi:hypothetical protein